MDEGGTCVLVGIDFSEGAMGAVREARWLARRTGLSLQALHVAGSGASWRPDRLTRVWMGAASVELSTLLVRRGLAWVEIVRHAKEVSAAMIVLGSYGASGVQSVTLGSTASRVALRAPCPVLFVAQWRERMPSEETQSFPINPF